MTNYEINWQSMAPGPYLSEKYEWSLDMSDSDASCNSSPVDSNSMGSYQSSPNDATWDYIPLVEKALGSMPIDELFPEPGLGNHQDLLNYDYCDNSLEPKHSQNLSSLDLIGDINNFALPDTIDPMSNEDTTKFDLTQFLCEDMNQDHFDGKICDAEPFQTEVEIQPDNQITIEKATVNAEEPQVDSETEIDVESVPDDFKPFFDSVDNFQPHHDKGKFKAKEKGQKKVPKKGKVIKKVESNKPGKVLPTKTVPIGRKDLKQLAKSTVVTSVDQKKNKVASIPQKNISQGVVEKMTPPAIIEASDGIGLLDRLEMFDLQMNQDEAKPPPKQKQTKTVPQRRTIPVEALPQNNNKRSKGKESKKVKEEPKEPEPQKQPNNLNKTADAEKKKQNAQPTRTLKEIPVINPQDWLYTPQKVTSSTKPKPPIGKLKLVRALPEGQKTTGQPITAAMLQQIQEKAKNKKIIVTQMMPLWKVEKSSNARPIKPQPVKVFRASEISTQTEPEKPQATPVIKKSWQNDHDYLNGATLVRNNYKPPMVSILKANVNKLKAQNEQALAQKKKTVQEITQVKRKVPEENQEVQPKKVLKLEDYKQRKPIPIVKTQIKEEPIMENITLAPFVPPTSMALETPQITPTAEEIKQEHPYVAPRPVPKHLQMKISRGVNTSQSWAHLEQMAKNHGLQFSCNSLISSMLEQLPENDISDKIFEDVVVTFAEKRKEKVETRDVGISVGTASRSRSRSTSPVRQSYGMQKSLGRGWGNKGRSFKEILDSVMERRVVFVGGIKEGTTNAQLAGLFVRFGEVEHTNIICDKKWQDGPDYCGFVTFRKADIAYEVISNGNRYEGLENFQLSFGGRRLFLQTPGYSDLDNMKDDEIHVREEDRHEESFAESLQIAHRLLLKKLGKVS